MQTHSTIFDAAQEESFLASLQPSIAWLAKRYYYRVHWHVSLDLADLEQEGMIAAWQALPVIKQASGARKYCLMAARGAMVEAIAQGVKNHATSLDEYLEPREAGGPARELADTHAGQTLSSLALRRAVLKLLRSSNLTANQCSAVMADFAIDAPATGKVETREEITKRLGIQPSGYRSLRARAMRNLRRTLNA